jgi:hypothetical protein
MLNLPGEWGWNKEMYSQCRTIIEQTQEKQEKLIAGVGQQANLTRQGMWWILELISWDRRQYSKLNCPALPGEELTTQSCSYRAMQCCCSLVKTTTLTSLH